MSVKVYEYVKRDWFDMNVIVITVTKYTPRKHRRMLVKKADPRFLLFLPWLKKTKGLI